MILLYYTPAGFKPGPPEISKTALGGQAGEITGGQSASFFYLSGKMTSKVHLALFLLFACTVTVSAVEDNFQGENGEKFSQQNGPSYTYEINK